VAVFDERQPGDRVVGTQAVRYGVEAMHRAVLLTT
jgi:hypothetical protein